MHVLALCLGSDCGAIADATAASDAPTSELFLESVAAEVCGVAEVGAAAGAGDAAAVAVQLR
jgi:hypothetical protein